MSEPGEFDLFDPATIGAHDDARDLWQDLVPPPVLRDLDPRLYELRLQLSPAETLARWHAAHSWADRDRDAAWAQRNAEDHLRRIRPAAMADYDRRVAGGADTVEAMRAATAQFRDGESSEAGRFSAVVGDPAGDDGPGRPTPHPHGPIGGSLAADDRQEQEPRFQPRWPTRQERDASGPEMGM